MNEESIPRTPLHPIPPLPVGTEVQYTGSDQFMHGVYTIDRVIETDELEASGRKVDDYYLDHVAYDLFPVGVEKSYRDRSLYFVRRTSITVITSVED